MVERLRVNLLGIDARGYEPRIARSIDDRLRRSMRTESVFCRPNRQAVLRRCRLELRQSFQGPENLFRPVRHL